MMEAIATSSTQTKNQPTWQSVRDGHSADANSIYRPVRDQRTPSGLLVFTRRETLRDLEFGASRLFGTQ
jgi:hypothetical protein